MPIEKVNALLKAVTRPKDFFGDISLDDIKKKYRKYAKYCHPDIVSKDKKDLAEETIVLLNEIFKEAQKEIEEGIYDATDAKVIYKSKAPIIEFEIKGDEYKFYDYLFSGDVTDTYKGVCNDEYIILNLCAEESDNELLEEEYRAMKTLAHHSIPCILNAVKINGKAGIITEYYPGYNVTDLVETYGPIPGNHVAWMLERMLSAAGYLHSNKIVHGNIKPSNVVINLETHNVMIKDYSLAITNANERDSKYKIVNEDYTPSYVNKDTKVIPNSDIYSIGKLAILLLGGDVKRNAMPISTDIKLRTFIRKLVSEDRSQNDAWALWDELIEIRNEIYGKQRFQQLVKKII